MALAGTLAATVLGACLTEKGYSYWILNDSDAQVLVDVREQLHRTFVVPPHTYGGLFSGLGGPPGEGWTVTLVDGQCRPLQTLSVDTDHNLVYVDPTGGAELTDDLSWSHGLRTATSSALGPRAQPCP